MSKNFENKKNTLIEGLSLLGNYILTFPDAINNKMNEAYLKNRWFTIENQELMLKTIASNYLKKEKLKNWLSNYKIPVTNIKRVGLIMAGNIPLVGFHDLLCVWLSGHQALIKLSSKDEILLPFLIQQLENLSPSFTGKTFIYEKLNTVDAIIATGNANSTRYFEYYFKNTPHLFRSARSSVAVISGNETDKEILELGKDIFRYFGMGCRNVSKLYLPVGYDPVNILTGLKFYSSIINHYKYKNNFDYNNTILLMNKIHFYANDFIILQKRNEITSRVGVINYEYYNSENDLNNKLTMAKEEIQCVVGKNYIPFGYSQEPELNDYADNIDTINFLQNL